MAYTSFILPTLLRELQWLINPLIIFITLLSGIIAFGAISEKQYQLLLIVSTLVSLIVYRDSKPDYSFGMRGRWAKSVSILLEWIVVLVSLFLLGLLSGSMDEFNTALLIIWSIITPVIMLLAHWVIRYLFERYARKHEVSKKCILVGVNDASKRLAVEIQSNKYNGLSIQGYFDDRSEERHGSLPAGIHRLGGMNNIYEFVVENKTNVIYLALPLMHD